MIRLLVIFLLSSVLLVLALVLASAYVSQVPLTTVAPVWAADSATVRVAAGPHYNRGRIWQLLWGAHYRREWATPVTVPVLRLATAVADTAGLAPVRAGGSYQSRTLRLRVASGREFVLRSVDKDVSRALPAGRLRTMLGGLLKDQTSVTQPYGAYVAARLAEAAGVFHTNPRLVYIADDPALGRFRSRYANALYLLEERPDGNQRMVSSFGRSAQVVSTARMLAAIHQHPRHRVADRAYLRARLLDMWLGDWSRREDQWRWASFPRPSGGTDYRPIPRDRDQAFSLFDDGLLTSLLVQLRPRFQSFHAHLRPGSVDHLTVTARALDQTLLAGLSAEDFRQEADSLRMRLSDAAIRQALTTGLPETQPIIATSFLPILRARREQLPAVAQRYYALLATKAWVVGTDQPERFVLTANGPGRVQIRVLAHRPTRPDSLLRQQTFDVRHTRRVDLFGLGGHDVFEVRGVLRPGFAIGLHGGNGHDQVVTINAVGSSGLTWFTSSNSSPHQLGGVRVQNDPEKVVNYNATSWLKRYRLDD